LKGTRTASSVFGFAFLILAFFLFLFYGNVAIGVAFLVLGVVLVVKGNARGSQTGKAAFELEASVPSSC